MKKKIKDLSQSGVFTRIVLPIILVVILAIIGWNNFKKPTAKNLSAAEIKTHAEEFINAYLMAPDSKATIKEVIDEYGLYKLNVDIVSDVIESYITKDGKLFFPQAFNVEEMQGDVAAGGQEVAPVEVPKTAKPNVEVFVMSHCPYGTQIEKGILPVAKALGDKIDFEIKFVDYAMHGEVELDEQLVQYCIQEEQNDKFFPYLDCFLLSGETSSCLAEANIDQTALDSCVTKTDNEFKVKENFVNNVGFSGTFPGFDVHKADNQKYGVAGSPTLVINETVVQSARDPQSLLTTICGAFENAPEECSETLPSASPAPGFGAGTSATASATAACN
ncbi:MAG: hypothetical protein PHX76_00740 [Patescibacteria group bacterium]|nr:hypothetical protein [Patescibacteria group bacterium]MDD4443496.1 hypothetical protein [Patescibacteria group bacterium]NCU39588.1 hypothetical protein [Candidatus Falkowbacteria bacterium]